MTRLITFSLLAFLLLSVSAFAEIKTITHTVQQPFGGSQSPDDARTAGIARAKREALEQFGTYIESTTVVKDSAVDSDEILALTAGVTKAEGWYEIALIVRRAIISARDKQINGALPIFTFPHRYQFPFYRLGFGYLLI